jgi:SNF2 family DNA or RNA helicase
MPESFLDIFEQLKPERPPPIKAEVKELFFQLNFDSSTKAYISILDETRNEVSDFDYRFYDEPVRSLIKAVSNIKTHQNFEISWELTGSGIYLSGNEFLLELLKPCNNFITDQFKKINFNTAKEILYLDITGDDKLSAELKLKNRKDNNKSSIKFITDNYILIGNTIYEIQPLNGNINYISYFEKEFQLTELSMYLSLLFSFYSSVEVNYRNYNILSGTSLKLSPSLMIDKVDKDNSLYLRVSSSLPGFTPELFEKYGINKAATVEHEEKKILINSIVYNDITSSIDYINKSLNKCKKNVSGVEDNSFYTEGSQFIIEEGLAKHFLQTDLHSLLEKYSVFGTSKIRSYKITSSSPKLIFSVSSEDTAIDFLEGDASLEIEGENISIFDALSQYKNNSYIKLSDGTKAIISPAYINRLQRLFKKKDDKVKLSFFDLPLVEDLIEDKLTDPYFIKSRKILEGFNTLSKRTFKKKYLKATLRPYQKQGHKWLTYLHENALGGCLADDMGLGKTLQTISLLTTIYPRIKTASLIVMPRSLLFNWENEIKRFAPELSFYTYYESSTDIKEAQKSNIILTTYGKLRSDIDKLRKTKFYYIILDESQSIKNINTQISRAVMLLDSKHRLALSGTPIENNLFELYALFRFLNPSMFGSAQDFNKFYTVPIQKNNDREITHELKKKIYPFILRRLKTDVLKDLPDKIEQTIYVEMSLKQKALYEQRRKFYRDLVKTQVADHGITKSQFVILQALTELRQIASIPEAKSDNSILSPKREVLLEKVTDAVLNNHKVLIFTNFLAGIEKISEDLQNNNIEYLAMTGATKDRKTLVEQFQNDNKYKVFIVTLKTGSLGLNLTAADIVFLFDPWWNNAAENQAVDRTHRIGQDKTVFSYKLIATGSIEEKILQLQNKKKDLFNSLISSDSASIKSLTEEDVNFILG